MRGEITNRERAKQLRDFSGLCWGKITPTDIDFAIDFGDTLYIYGEIKYTETPMPLGQRLYYEHQCLADLEAGREACALIVEHDVPPEQDIPVADCTVTEYWWHGAWHEPTQPLTCKAAIDILRKEAGIPL